MKVSLPFSYVLEFRLPRRKTALRQYFTDSVSFDLPEISSSETDVVADWMNHSTFEGDTPMTTIRWGDDLFVPADARTDVALMTTDFPKEAGQRVVSSRPFEALYGMRRGQTRYDTLHDTLFCVPRWSVVPRNIEVIQSTFEEERHHAENFFASLVAIDGKVWKRVPHLVLSMAHCEPQGYLYASVEHGRTGLAHRYESSAPVPFWQTLNLSLNRLDMMADFRNTTYVPDHALKFSNVSIHDPAALEFDALQDFMTRGAMEMTAGQAAGVGNMPADMVEGWLNLRDLAEAVNAGRPSSITDENIDFFREAFERLYIDAHREAGPIYFQVAPGVRLNIATETSGLSFVLPALEKLQAMHADTRLSPIEPSASAPTR